MLLSPGPDSWLPSHSPLASMAGAHVGTGEGWRKATIGGEGWKAAGRTWRSTESKLHDGYNGVLYNARTIKWCFI